ncbi:MAG: sensor histidine kinase [Marinoscillum sp.]
MKFVDLKIRSKLAFVMVVFAMAIITVISALYYYQFQEALKERVLLQLSSVKQLKIAQIEQRMEGIRETFLDDDDQSLRSQYGEVLFHGHVTNDTIILGYSIVLEGSDAVVFNDVSKYNSKGQLTISLEIRESNGYDVALIKPNLQEVLMERTGLGETGESYLVGSDHLMRTSSRFFPSRNPLEIEVKTIGVKEALTGNAGARIINDYRNIPVFSAYEKLQISNIEWVMLSEIDVQEALFPLESLKRNLFIVLGLILVLIFLVSYELSRQLVKPVLLTEQQLRKMSRGIFEPMHQSIQRDDEIGQMYKALDRLIFALEQTVAFANKIGGGDFEAQYELLSDEDQLGTALMEMKEKLQAYQINEKKLKLENQRSLISGEEKERLRLSRELHDGLGPYLTILRLKVESTEINPGVKQELQKMIDNTIGEMRRISNNLMPSVLHDFGAGEAIRNLVQQVKNDQIKINYQYDKNELAKVPEQTSIALYRVAQEAITNAIRHAHATTISLSLTEFEDRISLFIRDNGIGFDLNNANYGNGIRNMRERVNVERGIFELESNKKGSTIDVEIPIP